MHSRRCCILFVLVFSLTVATPAAADLPWEFGNNTRYMALGDSLVAGYGAVPATQGYVYLLYKDGVFDTTTNTLLSNAGVPGVTSLQVLEHQVPQAIEAFRPTVITLTVGGNDLLRILKEDADAGQVLRDFQTNFTLILQNLRTALPNARIVVSNLYSIPQIPDADRVIPIFNQIVASVAGAFNVPVADVYSAFLGREGLLLIERPGAAAYEVHPTNAGYRVMAQAFEAVIR
jgi:lysophospholipase L1-like esterase